MAEEEKKEDSSIKVGRMTLEQVEAEIENVKKTMGGLWSKHGKMLAAKREELKRVQAVQKKA